jgi:tetratricopeptide (TPR) repeat protein
MGKRCSHTGNRDKFPQLTLPRKAIPKFSLHLWPLSDKNSHKMAKIWNHQRLWICIGLAAVTLAVYSQVHRFDFIDLDDGEYVFENWHVTNGLHWVNVAWAFTSGHAANWHPVTWLSHMMDCQIFGLNAGFHHLVSLLLHTANSLLLFLLLQKLTGSHWRSAFVAALFALHPLHVESVAWIAERKDVLSTLFLLLTLWAYAGYVAKPRLKRYLLSLLFFALGLMAKPMLVTLPFVLLLLDYWPLRRFSVPPQRAKSSRQPKAQPIWRLALPLVREKLAFFLLAAVSSIVTFVVQRAAGAVKTAEVLPLDSRIANAIHSYFAYLLKAGWPGSLTVFYRLPPFGYQASEIALAASFLIGTTFLVIRFAPRYPYLAFGWFWYLGTLVPVIGLVQVGGQAMADRYTYIPLIGAFVIVAWGIPDVMAKWPGAKTFLAPAGAFLLLACSAAAWHQTQYWKDTISLFSHALEIDKNSYIVHELLGTGLAKRDKYQEAVVHYAEALRLQPAETHIMGNLGYSLYQLKKVDQAVAYYSAALKIKPDDPIVLRNLGQVRLDQGKFVEAVDCFRKAQRRTPDDFLLACSLGNALSKLGRTQEAIYAYILALRMHPEYPEALFGLGMALAGQGKLVDATRNFEAALHLSPGYADAHNNLGNILLQQGQVDKALGHYAEALRLNPKYAEAHYNMAVVLTGQGKSVEAITHYREAIRLKPDYADALYNLAAVLEAQGDVQGAVAGYNEAIRLKPDFVEAYNNLGVTLFNHGQIQKALDAFSGALRVDPKNADARRNHDAIMTVIGKSKRDS